MTNRSNRFALAQKIAHYGSGLLVMLFLFWACPGCTKNNVNKDKIVIGAIYSISGKLSDIQRQMVNGITLAVEEINQSGGILGRQIELIVIDGKSDPTVHQKAAESLIKDKGAVAIFGGSTAVDRKAMKSVVEKYNNILFFNGNYEGLEVSDNIVYMTLSPNQQLIPAISWSVKSLGNRFFLIGMDDIYSHTVNEILKDYIFAFNGELLGETYVRLSEEDINGTVILEALQASNPSVIINTLRGQHNVNFYKLLREGGLYSEDVPMISFWLTTNTVKDMGIGLVNGDYNIMDYFASIKSERNFKFIEAFQKRFGSGRNIDTFVERAYVSVYIWREAINNAQSVMPENVLKWIRDNGIQEPGGLVFMNNEQHPFRVVQIARMNKDGQFDILWESGYEIAPVNFPETRSIAKWKEFQNDLYEKWGKKWYR